MPPPRASRREEDDDEEVEDEEEEVDDPLPSDGELSMITENTRIKLKPYIRGKDPEQRTVSTVTVYGMKRSGKSVFIKWDLQEYGHELPWGWVFTKTRLNSHYASFVPEKFIITDFNADAMEEIMERQEKARKLSEDAHKQGKFVDPRIFLIWDDYMGKEIRFNDLLHRYYFTGRHYLSRNYYGAQHITMTPPPIRSNTEFAVLFNTDYADAMEHYWRDFAGKLPKDVFYDIFYRATKTPYHFLFINNDPNVPLAERFYTGIADVLDSKIDYITGSKEYWRGSEKQIQDIISGDFQRRQDLFTAYTEHHSRSKGQKTKHHASVLDKGAHSFNYNDGGAQNKRSKKSNLGDAQTIPEELVEQGPSEQVKD